MFDVAPSGEPAVWAPFGPRLAAARVTLLSSAGLHVEGEQKAFDLERERVEPTWGDPSFRVIPRAHGGLAMSHLHVNNADILTDNEVALPVRALDSLVADGIVGASSDQHISVMGYQGDLRGWRDTTVPAIVEVLRAQGTDGVVLAPV